MPRYYSDLFGSGQFLPKTVASNRTRAKLDFDYIRDFFACWLVDATGGNPRCPRRGVDCSIVLFSRAQRRVDSHLVSGSGP